MPDNVAKRMRKRKLMPVSDGRGVFRIGLGIDMPFLALLFVIVIVGLVTMFSASSPVAYYEIGDSYYYLFSQLKFLLIGVVGMAAISFFNYRKLVKFAWPVLGIAYAALALVLIIVPTKPKRWLSLGLFDIQPSEIAKFAVILFLAYIGSKYFEKMDTIKYGVMPGALVMISMSLLLFLEPHYSCVGIIILLCLSMMFISGTNWKWLSIGIGAIVGAVLIVWIFMPDLLSYAMSRLEGWGMALNENANRDDVWQTRNSIYAIGSGGTWGLGLGASRQKYLYLPEPQNDFVFAIVCEELGFIGAILILILFALLVWRGIVISLRSDSKFGKLLGIGLMSQVGLQVIMNIMVITDLMPNTGISLPFFSSGGSSLIILLLQMGLVLSISRTSKIEK